MSAIAWLCSRSRQGERSRLGPRTTWQTTMDFGALVGYAGERRCSSLMLKAKKLIQNYLYLMPIIISQGKKEIL